MESVVYVDPVVFRNSGRWWMFASEKGNKLNLFFSNELESGWQPHPQNPVVEDPNIARMAACGTSVATYWTDNP